MNRVHGGAAGISVQRRLRVVHHVDAFKCVNFTACGPVWGLRPEGGPDGALDVQREAPASSFSTCIIKNVDVPQVVRKIEARDTMAATLYLFVKSRSTWAQKHVGQPPPSPEVTNLHRTGRVTCPRSRHCQRQTDPWW